MLIFRRNLLFEFVLRTGLNIRTFILFFLTAFLPFSVPFFHSSLSFGFFVSPFVHIFNVLIYLALFFIACSLFLPCYVFPRFLSLSAHISVIGSVGIAFLLSMYVSESVRFSTP